jgi:hypothetical protein
MEAGFDPRFHLPLDAVERAALRARWRGGSLRRLRRAVEAILRVRDRALGPGARNEHPARAPTGRGTPVRAEPGVRWLAPAAMAGILAHARAAERVSPRPAFWVLSDLRVDLRPDLAFPEPLPAFDAMLVAGNVGPGLSASLIWLARALDGRQGRRPVCVVPGNVEYRSGTPMAEALARGRELAADLGIVLLSDDAFRFGPAHGDGTVVVGATLWTDWQLGASSGRPPARVAARTAWEEAGAHRAPPRTPPDAPGHPSRCMRAAAPSSRTR